MIGYSVEVSLTALKGLKGSLGSPQLLGPWKSRRAWTSFNCKVCGCSPVRFSFSPTLPIGSTPVPRKFLGIVGQDPSDSKSDRLHVDISRFRLIHLRH